MVDEWVSDRKMVHDLLYHNAKSITQHHEGRIKEQQDPVQVTAKRPLKFTRADCCRSSLPWLLFSAILHFVATKLLVCSNQINPLRCTPTQANALWTPSARTAIRLAQNAPRGFLLVMVQPSALIQVRSAPTLV